jgi:MFS family permease
MFSNAAPSVRFRGWSIVALMLGPRAGGTGTYILGGTLFVIPLEEALGLERSMSSLLFAVGSMVAGLSAPISGALMDRYGPRMTLLISVLVSALGYVLFAFSTNTVMIFIVFIGVISPVILNVAFNASAAFVNNWFSRYKATAMSFLQVGSSLGAIVIIPSMAFVIDTWDWRWAAMAAAGFVLALGLPAAFWACNTPEEMGLLPDGEEPGTSIRSMTVVEPTAGEAIRTPTFWFMVGAVTLFGGAQAGTQIHFVPMMVWKGLGEVEGAWVLTIMALVSTPAVLVMGPLADKLGRLTVAGMTSVLVAIGVTLLSFADERWAVWGAALIIAPNFGMYPLIWAALGEAFGRKAFSTIRGTVMAGTIAGTLGLPIGAGVLFDRTGSYASVLWIVTAMWLGAATLLFLAPRKSYVHVEQGGPTTMDTPAS